MNYQLPNLPNVRIVKVLREGNTPNSHALLLKLMKFDDKCELYEEQWANGVDVYSHLVVSLQKRFYTNEELIKMYVARGGVS